MTRRRHLLIASLAGASRIPPTWAQPAPRAQPWRIGILSPTSRTANISAAQPKSAPMAGFVNGLRVLGYENGRHDVIEARGAAGRAELYPLMLA